MSNHRWSKFYWADWERDPALRQCSLAAQGLWMRMLCQMDASPEHGFLVSSGRGATTAEIAKMVGCEKRQVERLMAELESHNVFSRDGRMAPFNRRMTRDCVISRINSANGLQGGNPVLIKTKDLDGNPVNPPLKPPLKAEAEADTDSEAEREKEPLRGSKKTAATDPKGHRLPADWNPGPEGEKFARDLGLDPAQEFAQFQDYWMPLSGANARKTDWQATWRNNCRRSASMKKPGTSNQRGLFPANGTAAVPVIPGWNTY